jgi:hypothetical protein
MIRSELMTGSQQPLRKSVATQTDRKLKTWVAGCGCDRREPRCAREYRDGEGDRLGRGRAK